MAERRLDVRLAVPDSGHGRLRSVYSAQGAYTPCRVIARALYGDSFERKVARARSCIISQIEHYRDDKSARVSNGQELERDFGQKVADKAIEGLTEEQMRLRARALALRAIMSKRNGKD